jgi:hypothetical protein
VNQTHSVPAPRQGAVIGGWLCFVLASGVMYFSLWTFWLYLAFLLTAFVLGIVAMSQRRILRGLLLMLAVLIASPIGWFGLAADRGDKFIQKHLPPEQLAAYNEGKTLGKLAKQSAATSRSNASERQTSATATEEPSEAEAFERRAADAVGSRNGGPSIIQLTGDTIPIVYEIKAAHPTSRETIAKYILGDNMDAFSKHDFVSKLSLLIDTWVAKAKPHDLYSVTVLHHQLGQYDFDKNAFPTRIGGLGDGSGDVELVDENGNHVLEQKGGSSELHTHYLICFANRGDVELFPVPIEKARLLSQAFKKAHSVQEVNMTFTGTLEKCVEEIDPGWNGLADTSRKRIYLNVSEIKITMPHLSEESMIWKVPKADGSVHQAKDEAQDTTLSETGPAPVQREEQLQAPQSTAVEPRPGTLYYVSAPDLNVRQGPGANFPTVVKLPGGFKGIRITGASVMNDTTEWVPVAFADQSGWVARRYIEPQ